MNLYPMFTAAVAHRHADLRLQNVDELYRFWRIIAKVGAKTYLEIGCRRGASAYVLSSALPDRGVVYLIDQPGGAWGERRSEVDLYRTASDMAAWGMEVHVLLANSHAYETKQRYEGVKQQRRTNVVFIDGDHTYDGVWNDWRMYCQDADVVGFHDICNDGDDYGVQQAFEEIAAQNPRNRKVIIDDGVGLGIGVLAGAGVTLPEDNR
jgi:predicted O-methyltransferase YrrM